MAPVHTVESGRLFSFQVTNGARTMLMAGTNGNDVQHWCSVITRAAMAAAGQATLMLSIREVWLNQRVSPSLWWC